MTKTDAIIVSAGKGLRFMEGKKKQFFSLDGKAILARTLDPFEKCSIVRSILLVVGHEDMDFCLKEIVEKYHYRKVSHIVPGGKRRQDSVKNGVDLLPEDAEVVVVHDGVRPFVTCEMIEESVRCAVRFRAAVLAIPVKDTIKMANPDGTIQKTLDRGSLWQIQTPQAFQTPLLREALRKASEDGFLGTDDASLVERLGVKVRIVPGSYSNIKITTPEDLIWATHFLQSKESLQKDFPGGQRGRISQGRAK